MGVSQIASLQQRERWPTFVVSAAIGFESRTNSIDCPPRRSHCSVVDPSSRLRLRDHGGSLLLMETGEPRPRVLAHAPMRDGNRDGNRWAANSASLLRMGCRGHDGGASMQGKPLY
ncbi:unnamed protein product [Musa acuminata subsp. burmannicoides]